MTEIATIGLGWVGKSMIELFPNSLVYDEPKGIGSIALVNQAEVAFIAVPTPGLPNGRLDTSIVEKVVGWCDADLLVIRSTLNPGDTDRFKEQTGKHIVFQPEFLGETPSHPMLDPTTRQWIVIGGEPKDRKKLIGLYATTYNSNTTVRQTTALEAEVIKLTENRAIGFKVMQMHELYQACEAAGIDYYTIRDATYGDDPRFDLWFSFIYPDNLGFNSSKCLVKDIPAWAAWAESVGIRPDLTEQLIEKSNRYAKNN